MRAYQVDFERDEHGGWIARVPELSGCHAYGKSAEDARRAIADAIAVYCEDWLFTEWARRERPRFPNRPPRAERWRATKEESCR